MKTKKDIKKTVTKTRNPYTPEFRKQALERAEKDGIAAVAQDLGLTGKPTLHLGKANSTPSGRSSGWKT